MTTCTTCWRICRRCGRRSPSKTARARRILRERRCWRPLRPRAASAAERRPADAAAAARRQLADVSRRLPGQRHSRLTQITPDNVHQLTLAWAFQTGQTRRRSRRRRSWSTASSTSPRPTTSGRSTRASGRQIWRYTYPANTGFHIGHRGAAVYKGTRLPDDARRAPGRARRARRQGASGTSRSPTAKKGYWSTNAPLLIRNHLIVGVSGDFDNLPGMLKSFDPETGKPQWMFYSTPPPGTPGSISGGATGGQMWMTGTYDPELNLVYRRHRQSDAGAQRPGAPRRQQVDLQHRRAQPRHRQAGLGLPGSPHDTHDWDAAEVPVLVDAHFNGTPRKLLLQASRNGYFFVLDRTTGKNLLTTPFAAVNWAKGIDEDGRPIPNPDKEPARDGRLVAPERRRRHQLSLAQLRSGDGPVHRQRARRLRHLLLQARARRVRLGGRGLRRAWARACCGRSTTRPARSAGATTCSGGAGAPAS